MAINFKDNTLIYSFIEKVDIRDLSLKIILSYFYLSFYLDNILKIIDQDKSIKKLFTRS